VVQTENATEPNLVGHAVALRVEGTALLEGRHLKKDVIFMTSADVIFMPPPVFFHGESLMKYTGGWA
jgi:hypothetical protein